MSPDELTIIAGFVAGFAGSIHCVAMCGGLVGVISASMRESPKRTLIYWCSYHFGRITSYTIAGFIAGGIAGQVVKLFPMDRAHMVGSLLAGLFLIILGGHVARWWSLLTVVEQFGGRLWQKVVPVFSKILPPRLLRHAIIGGLLWGWVPCGLVYSALVLAATSTDSLSGGLTMAAFGIGTLPMLTVMGVLVKQLDWINNIRWLRGVLGSGLCVLGIVLSLGFVPLHVGHSLS